MSKVKQPIHRRIILSDPQQDKHKCERPKTPPVSMFTPKLHPLTLSIMQANGIIRTMPKRTGGEIFVHQLERKNIKFEDKNFNTKQFKKFISKLIKESKKLNVIKADETVQRVLASLMQHANDLSGQKTQEMKFSPLDVKRLLTQQDPDLSRLEYFVKLPLLKDKDKRLPLNGKILCSMMELSREEYKLLRQNCPQRILDFELSYSGNTPFNCRNFLKILSYFSNEDVNRHALKLMSLAQLSSRDFSEVETILQSQKSVDAGVFSSPIIRIEAGQSTIFDLFMYNKSEELKCFLRDKNIASEDITNSVNEILDCCCNKRKSGAFNVVAYRFILDLFEYYKNADTVATIAGKCSLRPASVIDFTDLEKFRTGKFDQKLIDELITPKGSFDFKLTKENYDFISELLGSRFSINNIKEILNLIIKYIPKENYENVTGAIVERKNDIWKSFWAQDVLFSCITHKGDFNERTYEEFRKLDSITDETDRQNLFAAGKLIRFFMQFAGKNSVQELNKQELNSLFEMFISRNSLLINPSVKKCMRELNCDGLVPKDQEEFCAILKDILDVRKNAFYPLEKDAEEKFDEALVNIVKPLKHLKFSNPVKLEIRDGDVQVISEQSSIAAKLKEPLNIIYKVFPELLNTIGRVQNGSHEFTLDIHTLKVLKGIFINPDFQLLSMSDQKVLKLAALFHDYTKTEGKKDPTHPTCSAHEAYYILSKLHLSEDERRKIYTLINTHHWLEMYNKAESPKELERAITSIAFDLQKDNLFEMSTMLVKADLQAVCRNNKFYDRYHNAFYSAINDIQTKINDIKSTRIYIPQTTVPKASNIPIDNFGTQKITTTDSSGNEITNVVVDLQKCFDLREYGFSDREANFLVHLTYDDVSVSLLKTMQSPDSKAILSASLLYRNKLKSYNGRKIGVVLQVDQEDIMAAYKNNISSGCKKNLRHAKEDYFMDRVMSRFRRYFSEKFLIYLRVNGNQYSKIYEKIKDKSLEEIKDEYPNIANILDHLFGEWSSNGVSSNGNNEIVVYQPKVRAIFARNLDDLSRTIKKYAAENNLPIIILPEEGEC